MDVRKDLFLFIFINRIPYYRRESILINQVSTQRDEIDCIHCPSSLQKSGNGEQGFICQSGICAITNLHEWGNSKRGVDMNNPTSPFREKAAVNAIPGKIFSKHPSY
ncbi:hypothetical protein PM8797T_04440 [Gimesia maris DSM 8797]|nr:hypothetical protein PM8797T_04440 [Gimesia maris DSM 8797]HAW29682.1 hypothetical protein [Planctomycetaceae bacterium]|tara:strand:- start:6196 stop:6516 length:321 start_codon:yes stop_codon:yes gene_type:complete